VELGEDEYRSTIERIMVRCGLATSTSDARRKIEQGGVRIDGERLSGTSIAPDVQRLEADAFTLQVGKRAAVRVKRIS
jgi:tyrosyl-tRNA synthetase